MFESEFCKIKYIKRYNAILCHWKKFCQNNDYREPLEFGLSLINENSAKIWITDTTNGFESTKEDTKWLLEDFIPKTIDSSCDTIIFIIKNNSPLKNEIDKQSKELQKHFNVVKLEDLNKLDLL